MTNTVHGPYAATSWVNGSTAISQTHLNNLETQSAVALYSLNPDLISAAFVENVACVKDGSTANKLNITAGEAYLLMTDGTYARIDVTATNETTSTLNSTYYLYLQPDGTWYWSTSNSPATNSLAICQVTTDGSGNISGVTDKRVTLAALLSGLAHSSVGQPGGVQLPAPLSMLVTQSAALAGTVSGGVTFAQTGALRGSMDGAALFNGTSGTISLPTTGLPTGNAAWSIEAWVKMAAYPASFINFVVFGNFGTSLSAPNLGMNSSGDPIAGTFSGDAVAASPLSLNAWHHLVGTWDGTTLTLYVDGANVKTATPGTLTVTLVGASIGSSPTPSNYAAASIDEVALYSAALSSARVTAHYNAGTSTSSDGYAAAVLADAPLRYYRLGDASAATSAACTTSATATTLVDAAGRVTNLLTQHIGVLAPGDLIDVGGSGAGAGGTQALYFKAGSAGAGWNFQSPNGSTVASIGASGNVAELGGQATAGSFGVPVIVAQALNQHVTSVIAVTILTFTPSVAGLYRASVYVTNGNNTASSIRVTANWTDVATASAAYAYFTFQGSTALTSPTVLDGSNSINNTAGNGEFIATFPLVFNAATSGAITINYDSPSGTPNDHVSVVIERLS